MVHQGDRSDARANRARLIAAAVTQFAEHGVNAEIKDIAEQAGLSVGALYRHFPSKDDLIAAILNQIYDEFDAVLDSAERSDPRFAVRCFLDGSLAVVDRHGGLVTDLLDGGILSRLRSTLAGRREAMKARQMSLIVAGIRSGALRPDLDPEAAAVLLDSMLTPWSVSALRVGRSLDAIATLYAELFLRGAGA